jgi:SulP family sulfate permease
MSESWQQSPRRSHIHNVAGRVMRAIMRENEDSDSESNEVPEPAPTLFKTFSGYESDLSPMFFVPMLRYFTRVEVSDGTTLWERGDNPDGIYVVESGVLRAIYDWDNSDVITESMVSGTLSGELSGLANMTRNAKVVTEKDSVLWKLSKENWSRFKDEQPALAHRFVELVLKGMPITQFVRLLLIPVFQLPKITMIC